MDKIERVRGEKGGTNSVEYIALTEKLEEAHQCQQRLEKEISEGESLSDSLKRQLEERRAENEELKAELDLLRIKVQRLEQSTGGENDPGTT